MKLSTPIYRLRRRAKVLSREEHIPLHAALDRVAAEEGFNAWSLLVARAAENAPSSALLARLTAGDLVLLAARPGHGKTMMSLELTIEAMKLGRRGVFFSLEYSTTDITSLFRSLGEDIGAFDDRFTFDCSDDICAEYIVAQMGDALPGTVVVIDYLQQLDQKRENAELMEQVRTLKSFAQRRQLIIVFISQVDRTYDSGSQTCPGLEDIRLPNPLDLGLFSKACFLNDGEVQIAAVS